MRNILLILLFFISISLQAQQVEWGVNISPTISFRTPQQHNLSDQAVSIQAGEKPMHTFDFGIDLRAKINERLRVGTAVLYSQKGFSNIHVAAIFDDYRINRTYLIDYVQDYLEIPFFLTYSVVKKKKTEVYPMVGVSNSLLLHDKNNVAVRGGEVSEEVKEKIKTPYLKSTQLHNIGLLLGWGAMTKVDDKTYVGLEAQGKWMITPLLDQASLTNRHLYSFGLNFRFIRTMR